MKKLISNFLILILLFSSPTFSSDKKQEDYELVEKIITQGKIIHKRVTTYYGVPFGVYGSHADKRTDGADTWESLNDKTYKLELLISYKKKLYSCTFSGDGHSDFAFKEDWMCNSFLEKNNKYYAS